MAAKYFPIDLVCKRRREDLAAPIPDACLRPPSSDLVARPSWMTNVARQSEQHSPSCKWSPTPVGRIPPQHQAARRRLSIQPTLEHAGLPQPQSRRSGSARLLRPACFRSRPILGHGVSSGPGRSRRGGASPSSRAAPTPSLCQRSPFAVLVSRRALGCRIPASPKGDCCKLLLRRGARLARLASSGGFSGAPDGVGFGAPAVSSALVVGPRHPAHHARHEAQGSA